MLSTFAQRTLTGAVYVISILTLLLMGAETATVLLLLLAGLCSYEYSCIVRNNVKDTYFNAIFLPGILPILFALVKIDWFEMVIPMLFYISMLVLLILVLMSIFARIHIDHHSMGFIVSFVYIGIPFAILYYYGIYSIAYRKEIFLAIFISLWITDSSAYLFGKALGKNKLLERVSPGKTIEGSIGAGVCVLLIAYLLSMLYPIFSMRDYFLIAVVVWIFGTLGDLYESTIKRQFEVKDSGKLLPGHGGFLDRLDSFLLASPIVFLLLYLLH